MNNRPFVTARPRNGGQFKRSIPDKNDKHPTAPHALIVPARRAEFAHAHVPPKGLNAREAARAAAELDRLCAARPLKPPVFNAEENPTRSAGACELAREIRRGTFTP